MNTTQKPFRHAKTGMTLIEMSVVVLVMMILMGGAFVFSNKLEEWNLARKASEALRSVYAAQRMYMSDHPTEAVSSLTNEKLLPYMPSGTAAMPTVTSIEGKTLAITVTTMPPKIEGDYDPSGSPKDSLWDAGD